MARRSARIAGAAVKKSQTAPELSSVEEHDDRTIRDASQSIDGTVAGPKTPVSTTPVPPFEKMHPSKLRASVGQPSSASRFGFRDLPGEALNGGSAKMTSTPSKNTALPTSSFSFRASVRPQELSHEAQQVRQQLQDKTIMIKADMMAKRDAEDTHKSTVQDRLIAKPKGRSSRFSAAHMAEFKKMDSIQGHASAWRAQPGRFTPLASGKLKRSSSKANLDETPASPVSTTKTSSYRSRVETSSERLHRRLRRASQNLQKNANHDATDCDTKPQSGIMMAQPFAAKRQKQHKDDDSSAARPVDQDAMNLSRPATLKPPSRLASLLSPTKSSMARSARSDQATPSLIPSPSKSSVSGLVKSTRTTNARSVPNADAFPRRKIIMHSEKAQSDAGKSAIPQPTAQASQTPAPRRVEKEMPMVSMTTPRHKSRKRVTFADMCAEAASDKQRYQPTPWKPKTVAGRTPLRDVSSEYLTQDDSPPEAAEYRGGLYPDLSPLRRLIRDDHFQGDAGGSTTPGAFTFRSDRTINVDDTPVNGFGSALGHLSVRQVESTKDAQVMAGQHLAQVSPSVYSDKENSAPALLSGAAHGLPNKKRHRADSDSEDGELESANRLMKKKKREHVSEGDALFAPDLVGGARDIDTRPMKSPRHILIKVPSRVAASASPSKRTTTLSRGRLDMLARPKNRG